jgi:hypothetical protein
MIVDEDGDMIKGSFKWLALELEDLVMIKGTHYEKGPYTEYFLPSGDRVLGTRTYEEESDCCTSQ